VYKARFMSPSILISSFFYFIKGKVGGAAYFSNRYGGEKFEHFFLDEASIFVRFWVYQKSAQNLDGNIGLFKVLVHWCGQFWKSKK